MIVRLPFSAMYDFNRDISPFISTLLSLSIYPRARAKELFSITALSLSALVIPLHLKRGMLKNPDRKKEEKQRKQNKNTSISSESKEEKLVILSFSQKILFLLRTNITSRCTKVRLRDPFVRSEAFYLSPQKGLFKNIGF